MAMRTLTLCLTISLSAIMLSGCGLLGASAGDSLIERLNAEAAVRNAKLKIAFDPARETIITDSAPYLTIGYRLNVAHREEYGDDDRPKRYDAFRAVRYPNCAKPKAETEHHYILGNTQHRGICQLHIFDDELPSVALTTHAKSRIVDVDGRKVRRLDLTIKRPDGRSAVLEFYPGRSDFPLEAAPQIAAVLGLHPRRADDADMPGPDAVDRLIASTLAKSGGVKYAWLDELALRDPATDPTMAATRFDPAEIAKRGEALTRRFEQMAPKADTAPYWGMIGHLLARLPQREWVLYRDRIAGAMMQAPKDQVSAQIKLLHRMTDMGAAAGPVLARAYGEDRFRNEIAIAICRTGDPIAPHLGKALMASWKATNSPRLTNFHPKRRWRDRRFGVTGFTPGWRSEQRRKRWEQCTAHGKEYGPPANIAFSACWAYPATTPQASPTYLALRRMGLGDKADAMMKHQYSIHWKKTYGTIGPSSPAKVCGESQEM